MEFPVNEEVGFRKPKLSLSLLPVHFSATTRKELVVADGTTSLKLNRFHGIAALDGAPPVHHGREFSSARN